MSRVRAWLNTPLPPRTRKAALASFVVGVLSGIGTYAREERVKKLETRVAKLEADRRAQKGNLK